METFLFNDVIFGPVNSRRLGDSLGINLLPTECKICNFNCIYCECGWTYNQKQIKGHILSRVEVYNQLEVRLQQLLNKQKNIDSITFAGNGEPTLHPQFAPIVDDVLLLRDRYYPQAHVSVLSNAGTLNRPLVIEALMKVDRNIQKLDSAIDQTFWNINQPNVKQPVAKIIEQLQRFDGKVTIQTLFLRGNIHGRNIDNTTPAEIEAWINALLQIKPARTLIYSLHRATPAENLEKIPLEQLQQIALQAQNHSLPISVYD